MSAAETVTFNDNLYGYSPSLRERGCGLFGACRTGFWTYERHADGCKPGMWRVALGSPDAGAFWKLGGVGRAVVDDFGNLQLVEVE